MPVDLIDDDGGSEEFLVEVRRWIERIKVLDEDGQEIKFNLSDCSDESPVVPRAVALLPSSGPPNPEVEELFVQARCDQIQPQPIPPPNRALDPEFLMTDDENDHYVEPVDDFPRISPFFDNPSFLRSLAPGSPSSGKGFFSFCFEYLASTR